MGKIVYHKGNYIITEEHSKRGYIVINTEGTYLSHAHIKKLSTCKMLISLIEKEVVPDSAFLRVSALRLSTSEKYTEKIYRKIEKQKDKQQYFNVNKGPKGVKKWTII